MTTLTEIVRENVKNTKLKQGLFPALGEMLYLVAVQVCLIQWSFLAKHSTVTERRLWCDMSLDRSLIVAYWKEMFYLTTHSTHYILRLYGIGHMVKDHSDSERGNTLPPHGLLFPINSKGSFICTIPRPLLHQSWSTGWNEK